MPEETEPELCAECGERPKLKDRSQCWKCKKARVGSPRTDVSVHKYGEAPTPAGFHLSRVTQHVDAKGRLKQQWVQGKPDRERLVELLSQIGEDFSGKIEPYRTIKREPLRSVNSADFLNVFPVGDPHIGMFASAKVSGEAFDLKIAKADLATAFDIAVDEARPADTALLAFLGDMTHSDGSKRATTKGTPAPLDAHWPDVLECAIAIVLYAVDKALTRHDKVHVWMLVGNHDGDAAITLKAVLKHHYRSEPRVVIDDTPSRFSWFRFGQCLLGGAHGDETKSDRLPGVMARDRREDWGEVRHCRWYTGHVHHESVKEYQGVVVETFRTLAPGDDWHHGQGYRSDRDMRCDTWHKDHGLRWRGIVPISLIQETRKKEER